MSAKQPAMLKWYFLLLTVPLSGIFSSDAVAQFGFQLEGGWNIATMSPGGLFYQETKPGYHPGLFQAGLLFGYKFKKGFGIETGFRISQKGYKQKIEDSWTDPGQWGGTNKSNIKVLLNYIDFPLHALYRIRLQSVNILFLAGPYVGIGISGKYKQEYTLLFIYGNGNDPPLSSVTDLDFGDDYGIVKTLDFGLEIGTGLEFGNTEIRLIYGFGLTNLALIDPDEFQPAKNRVIGLSIGYRFGKD